jgi:3-deoxy-7-phosphoheptulonate synthase
MEFNYYDDLSIFGSSVSLRVSRKSKPETTQVNISGIHVGGSEVVIIAGPCAVENREQLLNTAKQVHAAGANILRGGAFKPRTSPYSFQGLGEEGLKYLDEARKETGMPVVTEVMDTRQLELVCKYTDIIQIGSRNMHSYPLLKEAGKCKKPVLLKRGMMATIQECLLAAEYILCEGNQDIILCERGIRTFDNTTRFTLDLAAVPLLKRLTHLPVIVDPSHGTGHSWMVPAMAKAAIAAGADGIMVEVHYKPFDALSDGQQSLNPEDFAQLVKDLEKVAHAVGRKLFRHKPSPA